LKSGTFGVKACQYDIAVEKTKRENRGIGEMAQDLSNTDKIISKYEGDESALIQVLLELQRENQWLSRDVLRMVGERLRVPLIQVYHVATFYKAFNLVPRGRHVVVVCLGTACHVRGAPRLLDKVIESLKIRPGETSKDMRFSLDTVNCLGCCALGPMIVVDGDYHGKISPSQVEKILSSYT
jgi:NADH-quinone oxidoreductase subunit E